MNPDKRTDRKKRWRWIGMGLLLAALLAGGVYALWKTGWLDKIDSVEDLRAWIDSKGPKATAAYFLLEMMTVIIAPIPSNISMMAGALALGFWEAVIVGVLAVVAGSVILFLAARKLGSKAVQRFLDRGVMDKYLPVIEEKQGMFLFLTMLFPFFPDDALCILAGLSSIPFGHFLAIMMLARPWGLIFAALLGSGAITMPVWGWVLLAVPLAILFYLGMKYAGKIEDTLFRLIDRLTKRDKKEK